MYKKIKEFRQGTILGRYNSGKCYYFCNIVEKKYFNGGIKKACMLLENFIPNEITAQARVMSSDSSRNGQVSNYPKLDNLSEGYVYRGEVSVKNFPSNLINHEIVLITGSVQGIELFNEMNNHGTIVFDPNVGFFYIPSLNTEVIQLTLCQIYYDELRVKCFIENGHFLRK